MAEARYVLSNVEAIGKELEMLPEMDADDRPVTTREAVLLLLEQIRTLRKKGYSLEKVSQVLTERGLRITVHTLRGYLQKASKRKRQRRTTEPRRAAAAAVAAPPPAAVGSAGEVRRDAVVAAVGQGAGAPR